MARSATFTNSRMSKGFGKYSNAPRSVARIAVMSVFWPLTTITLSSGLARRIFGKRSKPFSSGITTSVTTMFPKPSVTQRQRVEALPVALTSNPARMKAWVRTVRIERSSSAKRITPLLMISSLARKKLVGRH